MRFVKYTLALAAGLLVSGPALAQPPGGGAGGFGGFGGFGGGLANSIARVKPLQDELKVDAEQLEKLTAALTKAREESRDLTQKLFGRDTSAEERAEATKKIQEINDKALASALKPEQVKRLKQIETQQAGLGAFTRGEASEKLKLTDEQKEKVTAINRDLSNDRRELFGAGGGGGGRRPGAGGGGGGGGGGFRLDPEVVKKLENLQKEAIANAVKVLNDDQKSTYKELTGEPFEMPGGAGALGFGGFGGGGGGGFGQPGGGGFGGFGGGGTPGTVLSTNAQQQLRLTDDQKKELERIQKEVDAQLEKVLTPEQRTQLKEMRDRQPAGGGGRTRPKKDD